MERRDVFRILAAGAVAGSQASAQHPHVAGAVVDLAGYKPRFFTAAEYETQHEGAPENELERLFGSLKRMTVEGYVLSDLGARQGLGYKGDTNLAEFPGCTHPEHKT